MRGLLRLCLCSGIAVMQGQRIEPSFQNITIVIYNDIETGEAPVRLQATGEGGLIISKGYDSVVEVIKDGTIKGDPVRALRLTAEAMKQANEHYRLEYFKYKQAQQSK